MASELVEPLAEQLHKADHCIHRELRCANLAQCADKVDFIAPAENMRRFFRLLHDDSAISLAVHRRGRPPGGGRQLKVS